MSDFSRSVSRAVTCAALVAALLTPCLVAQAPAQTPLPAATGSAPIQFDVVSVKANTSESGMIRIANRPGMFSATGTTLKMLISQAYNIREDLIGGGPGWVGSSEWDVEGKIAPADADALKAMPNEQRSAAQRLMMQHALMDRFKLKTHTETKTLPVYELVPAKGGPKLKEADPNNTYPNGIKGPDGAATGSGRMQMQPGKLTGHAITMSSIANFLARNVERTVIDKTGLAGKYDVTLTWKPDDDHGGPQDNGTPDANLPDLFTAIQEQLGVKLVPAKGPVETLIIDSVEKPTEN